MEIAQAIEGALVARTHFGGELSKETLNLGVGGFRCRSTRGGDGLDRFAFGDEGEERLFGGGEFAVRRDRSYQRFDDRRVEGRATGRHHANRLDQLRSEERRVGKEGRTRHSPLHFL